MATKTKHMERSRRSSHNPKPFASFERKAVVMKEQKTNRKGFLEGLKQLFHRTTNK